MKVEVVCYSGFKGDERPVRFLLDGQDYFVEELLDQWYAPQDIFFKVRANDYILRRRSSAPERIVQCVMSLNVGSDSNRG